MLKNFLSENFRLKTDQLFEGLTAEELESLTGSGVTHTYKKGEIIFCDGRLNRIIKIAGKQVTTIAGNSIIQPNSVNMGGRSKEGYKDGKALTALFNFPLYCSIAIDSKQNIYIIDGGNDCIRKLSADGMVSTFATAK